MDKGVSAHRVKMETKCLRPRSECLLGSQFGDCHVCWAGWLGEPPPVLSSDAREGSERGRLKRKVPPARRHGGDRVDGYLDAIW